MKYSEHIQTLKKVRDRHFIWVDQKNYGYLFETVQIEKNIMINLSNIKKMYNWKNSYIEMKNKIK